MPGDDRASLPSSRDAGRRKELAEAKIVVNGVGAAGHAIIQLLQAPPGAKKIVAWDQSEAIHAGPEYTRAHRRGSPRTPNPADVAGTPHEALMGRRAARPLDASGGKSSAPGVPRQCG